MIKSAHQQNKDDNIDERDVQTEILYIGLDEILRS